LVEGHGRNGMNGVWVKGQGQRWMGGREKVEAKEWEKL